MKAFALKSPIALIKYGLFFDNFSKFNSKFCENDKNDLEFDLEIYKEQQNSKVYHLFLTRNLYICPKDLYWKLLREENFCNKYKHLHACC